jgi:acetyl-CoA carboxylase carboxyl transferase subunit beta
MSWLEKLLPSKIQQTDPTVRRQMPEGLWIKCPSCETVLYKADLEQNQNVCPKCSHHHRIGARARLDAFLDPEGRYEIGQEVIPVDALKFKDSRKYPERLKEALENTGETDALVVMGGAVKSINVVAACFEFDFMGGSMGSRWWASASCAAWKAPSSKKCPSSASPPPAARACRKACSR